MIYGFSCMTIQLGHLEQINCQSHFKSFNPICWDYFISFDILILSDNIWVFAS